MDDNMLAPRQRSESLIRRQKELFDALNMDFSDNDRQQNEDENFDLEIPFEINFDNSDYDQNRHTPNIAIRNFVASPNEFNSSNSKMENSNKSKYETNVADAGNNDNSNNNNNNNNNNSGNSTRTSEDMHFALRNFATSPNEFTSFINVLSSGGFDAIDIDENAQTISENGNSEHVERKPNENSTEVNGIEKKKQFDSPPRKLTRSLSEEQRIITPKRKPSPYKTGSFALQSPGRIKSEINGDDNSKTNRSANNSYQYSNNNNPSNSMDEDDTISVASNTTDGNSGNNSIGASPISSANSFTSLHTAHGCSSLNNSFALNRSILEIDESDSESDGGDEMMQRFRYCDSSSSDEEEINLIKSITNNNNYNDSNSKRDSKNTNVNMFRRVLFHGSDNNFSKNNGNNEYQLTNDDSGDEDDAHKIPINAKNLPLLEQQSHESHDVLLHGQKHSSNVATENRVPLSSSSTPITQTVINEIKIYPKNHSTTTHNTKDPLPVTLSNQHNNMPSIENEISTGTNQHIDKDNKYFYFDSTKTLSDIPDASENLVEWQTCVTVTGKTRHQRVFPEFKNGVEVNMNGGKIALFRYLNDVYAMKTQCPHRKGPIQMGDIEDLKEHGPCVVCPWHRWTFKLNTGKLVKPENRSIGDNNNLPVFPVQLRGVEKKIFVGFPNFSNKIFEGNGEDF